jgi:uncharacterized RDD family membrane protein YckC
MLPVPLPPEGLRIPLRAAFVGVKGVDWVALAHNSFNPLLRLYDTEVEARVFRTHRRPYGAIEYVDFRQGLGTQLLVIAWRDSSVTFSGNLSYVGDLSASEALRELLRLFESKQVPLSPRAQTWLHGSQREEAARSAPIAGALSAGIAPRLLANFADLIVLSFISGPLAFLLNAALSSVTAVTTNRISIRILDWFCFLFLAAIFDASRLMGTPGKRLFGIAVVDAHDQSIGLPRALLRTFLKWLAAPLTLLQALLYRPRHPGPLWHDALSGTRVVEGWSVSASDRGSPRVAPSPIK